ncbi:MAG: methyltransferase domain-containing protein [Pseudomonadota bacterium]
MTALSLGQQNRLRKLYRDPRPLERIQVHYDLERRLADRLRESDVEARKVLYGELYDELFSSLPDHPQHFRRESDQLSNVRNQLRLLKPLVRAGDVFVEVGAGDCQLSYLIAPDVQRAIGVDVSDKVYDPTKAPENFDFVKSDGLTLGLEAESADFVYSNQLMEHLHVDDAKQQLIDIHRTLRPGGRYFCTTPNAISGPSDVSRYFDRTATGFHMKEYRYRELIDLFRAVGFKKFSVIISAAGRKLATVPPSLATPIEATLAMLPWPIRQRVARFKPVRIFLGIKLIAVK